MLFDLASLTKPLVTAPLALEHLDLDKDWSLELGFKNWSGPITPRLLLSHSAGLPPWLPFTGEPVAEQIEKMGAWGLHPLLKKATLGESTYSDIGYKLLAEMLEIETGKDWKELGKNLSGLDCAPWGECPVFMPPGADFEAWSLATREPFPVAMPDMPHDANARAGMKGHAGFGATPETAKRWLEIWNKKHSAQMAIETCHSTDGEIWGLGLQRLRNGEGSFAELLDSKTIHGIHIIVDAGFGLPPITQPHTPAEPSDWWFHFGYTGSAIFVRPSDGACIMILCHRLGSVSELLKIDELRARRRQALEKFLLKM
jgi:CubicO group peptidase (beta-lactamase class C family)